MGLRTFILGIALFGLAACTGVLYVDQDQATADRSTNKPPDIPTFAVFLKGSREGTSVFGRVETVGDGEMPTIVALTRWNPPNNPYCSEEEDVTIQVKDGILEAFTLPDEDGEFELDIAVPDDVDILFVAAPERFTKDDLDQRVDVTAMFTKPGEEFSGVVQIDVSRMTTHHCRVKDPFGP